MTNRELDWTVNKVMFEPSLEFFLSHCPNMTDVDDKRDICKDKCPAYYWCVSIEPSENILVPPIVSQVQDVQEVPPPISGGGPPTKNSSILSVKKVKKLVTNDTENVGEKK